MPDLVSCLRKDLAALKPDFILATGDLVGAQSRDATFAARDLLDSLGFPYYPLGGNQDFALPDARALFVEAFGAHIPAESTAYSFTHQNLHVCALDPWWVWPDGTLCPHRDGPGGVYRWAVPPSQLKWLENDLERHENLPTIFALHFPLAPTPSRLRRPGMLDYGHLSNADLLLSVVRTNPQVVAVFSGHAHMNFIVQDSGVTHVVTAALVEYPAEYRVVSVHGDRMEVHTAGVSDKSFAATSLVTAGGWTAGELCDRTATISLRRPRWRNGAESR
jgi:3',5'-cyclic AMP phosphodiesterase CpdA